MNTESAYGLPTPRSHATKLSLASVHLPSLPGMGDERYLVGFLIRVVKNRKGFIEQNHENQEKKGNNLEFLGFIMKTSSPREQVAIYPL